MKNIYKKLSSHGSISIPVAMRRAMGLQGGDPMEVSQAGGIITVKPYTPRCIFCGTNEDVVHRLQGKYICGSCAAEVLTGIERGGEA